MQLVAIVQMIFQKLQRQKLSATFDSLSLSDFLTSLVLCGKLNIFLVSIYLQINKNQLIYFE